MKATLYTPNDTAPKNLALDGLNWDTLTISYVAPAYKFAESKVFIDGAELLAIGTSYIVFAAENAADYASPCPSAIADLERLTGTDWSGENQPYGPILVIEA
ncbi:MAG: hypothetical protein NVS3B25_19050 [Hymenobacter sp.]